MRAGGVATRRRQIWRWSAILVGAGLAALAAAGTTVGQDGISLSVGLWNRCLSGSGPPSSGLFLVLAAPDGTRKDRVAIRTGSSGDWSVCFADARIAPRDRLSAHAAGERRMLRIPNLRLSIWRDEDVIAVEGPTAGSVGLAIRRRDGFGWTVGEFETDLALGGDGGAIFDAPFDLRGRDRIRVTLVTGDDQISITSFVPFVRFAPGDPTVAGAIVRGHRGRLWLDDADGSCEGVSRGSARVAGERRTFRTRFVDGEGKRIRPRRGDFITRFGHCDDPYLGVFIPPGFVVRGDPSSDVVEGRCSAYQRSMFRIVIRRADRAWTFLGETRPRGGFDRPVGPEMDLRHGDRIELACILRGGDILMALGKAAKP